MIAVPPGALFAALSLLPKATVGHLQAPYYPTCFANVVGCESPFTCIGSRRRRRRRRPRPLPSVHGKNAATAINGNHPIKPLHASFRHSVNDSSGRRISAPRFLPRKNAAAASTKRRKLIEKVFSKIGRYLRGALLALSTLALVFSLPTKSWAKSENIGQSSSASASGTSSSSYYLQKDPGYNNPPRQQQGGIISIETQKSRGRYSNNNSDYRIISNNKRNKLARDKRRRSVRRITTLVLMTTFAASSHRASLRTSRTVRSATPFGRIRNASVLGNGVSVIRVCVALGLDESGGAEGEDGAVVVGDALLRKLRLEKKELDTKIAMLAQRPEAATFGHKIKQKALGEYVSNVASTLLQHRDALSYGSIDSIRVPFAEEATKAFGLAAKEERKLFVGPTPQQQRQQSTKRTASKKFLLATILIAIKGDRTSVPLPFGVVRRRDVATALSRIATDATVDDCLVGAEFLSMPDAQGSGADEDGRLGLAEEEMLKLFRELVPLT